MENIIEILEYAIVQIVSLLLLVVLLRKINNFLFFMSVDIVLLLDFVLIVDFMMTWCIILNRNIGFI